MERWFVRFFRHCNLESALPGTFFSFLVGDGDILFNWEKYTPKTNMEPEKDGFQKESPFPNHHFQVPCSFRGCIEKPMDLSMDIFWEVFFWELGHDFLRDVKVASNSERWSLFPHR